MKKFSIAILSLIFGIHDAFAGVVIVSLLPNPAGDDTLSEHIEIRNIGCSIADVTGFSLSDVSGKSYTLPSGTTLASHESQKFPYSVTKISLNNSGDETIYLKDGGGNVMDFFSYSGTQKDNILLEVAHVDEDCGASSGSTGSIDGSGSVLTETGMAASGNLLNTGSIETLSGGVLEYGSGSDSDASGSISQTGNSLDFSGEVLAMSSGSTQSGGLIAEGGGDTSESSGHTGNNISPKWLSYSDTDGNGKIDRLEILYDITLSGVIIIDQIAIYSASGGLSDGKINTETGYISSASISGNTLMLDMQEGALSKTELKINATVTSELRLKSLGDIGLRSSDGDMVEGFFLTTSFASYKNVGPKTPLPGAENSTGSTHEVSSSGSDEDILSSSGIPIFPEVLPVLQSPSNVIFASGVFLCDELPCKLNITIAPIFTGTMLMKNYTCSFGTGELILELDSDCNPNTFSYSSSGSIIIELIEKSTSKKFRTIYPIILSGKTIPLMRQGTAQEVADSGKPVARIQIDGKWKEYYEKIGDYEMSCYTLTCSLNFSAEDSFDPEGSTLRYLWIYGLNSIKTTRDPGSIKYELGDHRMILRVIDSAGNYDEIIYIIHVLGPKPKKLPEKKEVLKSQKSEKTISSSVKNIKKKFKKIRMEFFSPPEIALQGKTGQKISSALYQCSIKTAKTCSINFSVSGALSSFDYLWILDGKEVFRGKNPKSWKLSPGKHTLLLRTYRKGATLQISEQTYNILVKVLPKKAKKPKSTLKKPKKVTTQRSQDIIPSAAAEGNNSQPVESNESLLLFLILFSGLFSGYILRGRKKSNHSS